jgi:predicted O-methyltransferase YrrM
MTSMRRSSTRCTSRPGLDFGKFLKGISFELVQPDVPLGPDDRFTVMRENGTTATLFQLPSAPYDTINATLGASTPMVRRALRPHCEIPRMGSFAGGAILNQGVRRMGPGEAYVNVGTWHGFSLLSGMAANPDKRCIGIDNFTYARAPRATFEATFNRYRSPAHSFFDGDYRDYFANHHDEPIGLYFYDGNHDYEDQVRGLQIAEPYFADGCVVVVDDTNWQQPRQGTYDFIAQSEREYEVLLDVGTADRWHPTFWNGLIVFQARAPSAPRQDRLEDGRPGKGSLQPNRVDFDTRDTLASIVVFNDQPDAAALAATIEATLAQTWPRIEVLVADSSGDGAASEVIEGFGDQVLRVAGTDSGGFGARAALEASRGSLVGFVDPFAQVEPFSVEAGLALPDLCHFSLGGRRHQRMARALAAGADMRDVIPPEATFAFAGSEFDVPRSLEPRRPISVFGDAAEALDQEGAVSRLADLSRNAGATHAAFLWTRFDWLAARPRLVEHLSRGDRCLVSNDNVRIFALGSWH